MLSTIESSSRPAGRSRPPERRRATRFRNLELCATAAVCESAPGRYRRPASTQHRGPSAASTIATQLNDDARRLRICAPRHPRARASCLHTVAPDLVIHARCVRRRSGPAQSCGARIRARPADHRRTSESGSLGARRSIPDLTGNGTLARPIDRPRARSDSRPRVVRALLWRVRTPRFTCCDTEERPHPPKRLFIFHAEEINPGL
jgi:hypothetical protein